MFLDSPGGLWVPGSTGTPGTLMHPKPDSRFSDAPRTRLRVPGILRNYRFAVLPGTPGSLSHPEPRLPGIVQNSVFPESHGFPCSGATRRILGHRIILWTTGSRSQPKIQVPRVNRNSVFPDLTCMAGSWNNPEIRIPGVTRNSAFPESPGTSG